MSEIDWRPIEHLAAWLRKANGMDPHQQAVQIMKIGEEVGEVAEAATYAEELAELCDVALTALVALYGWSSEPHEVYRRSEILPRYPETLAGIYGRAVEVYIGYLGQNPRKGRTHEPTDVADALCHVAHAALRDIRPLAPTADIIEIFNRHLNKVADRVGV